MDEDIDMSAFARLGGIVCTGIFAWLFTPCLFTADEGEVFMFGRGRNGQLGQGL